jgi:hypothetical protein
LLLALSSDREDTAQLDVIGSIFICSHIQQRRTAKAIGLMHVIKGTMKLRREEDVWRMAASVFAAEFGASIADSTTSCITSMTVSL